MAVPGTGAWRIAQAVSRRADMLGEEDSFQVVLEREMGDRILGKYGAEGLFCVAVRDADLGFAVRVEDGGPRAIGPIVLDVLLQLGAVREDELGELMTFREPILRNWRGTEIGTIRASAVLTHETSDARS
jgi:L-asparaginase II